MKKNRLVLVLLLFLWAGCTKSQDAPYVPPTTEDPDEGQTTVDEQIKNAEWVVSEVSEGIEWKYFHFNDLFSSNQYITVFEIDLSKGITIDIPYVTEGFLKTSDAAVGSDAVVAINGSFFDTSKGGSTVFFRKDGEVVNYTRNGFTPYRENAGFSSDESGKVSIVKRPTAGVGGWASVDTYTLLASGPLLIYDGELVDQLDKPFNTNRHPRTAIGITADRRVFCVVVDGRSSESHGMSTTELSKVMHALGCVQAMNLDGGGSSTAWVKDKGIVNHPTDNKQFDHEGERGVANAIVFK